MLQTTEPRPATTAPVPASALKRRPAAERGYADHGWLKSAHSFSFAGYFDPEFQHFEALRVINDDHVAAGGGFPMHPHQDFEIFSYLLSGQLAHEDSMGNGSTVTRGGVQYMTAGTGVRHSEFNPSRTDPVHFLQIWLIPKKRGATPHYETLDIADADKDGRLALFISEDGRDGSIRTLAPADVYAGVFGDGQSATFSLAEDRKGWVQVARGSLRVNGVALEEGDGLAIEKAGLLTFDQGEDAEIVFFDLASLS